MKKQKSNIITVILVLLLLTLSSQTSFTLAQNSVDDLEAQKVEKKRQLLEIKEKISEFQNDITDQRGKIASLNNELALFDLQIRQTEEQIKALETEVEFVNLDIIGTLKQIFDAENNIATKKELLASLIRGIYETDQASPLELILENNNFSDFLNAIQNTISFQKKNQELLTGLRDLKEGLVLKRGALESKRKELDELKSQAQEIQNSLLAQATQRQGLLSYTRGQEGRYQQLLHEVSDEEEQIKREIFDLDLSIRNQLGDKTLPTITDGFSWPLDGVLTQGYGNTGFTSLGYSFHNGLDIAAPANTPLQSVGDGVVYSVGTGETAYGNWAVVKYTVDTVENGTRNVMALYAHMNKILVSSGQGVLRGDLIGLVGNTGNTTRLLYGPERGFHVHFSIFDEEGFGIKEGSYQDIYGPYRIPFGYSYNPFDFFQ